MGSYQLNINQLVNTSGSYGTDVGFLTDPNAKYYYVGVNPGGGSTSLLDASFTLQPFGNCISLDGGPLIPLSGLPSGFNLPGAGISLANKNNVNNWPISLSQRTGIALSSLFAKSKTQYMGSVPFNDILNGTNFGPTFNAAFGPTVTPSHIIDLFSTLTVELIVNDASKFSSYLFYDGIVLNGAYSIISTQWVINNLTLPGTIFRPGDIARLTTNPPPPPTLYDFSTITKITLNTTDILPPFILQEPTGITFQIPPTQPPGDTPTTITNPTVFTGDALVATLSIVIADSSGIYTITSGKTSDTLYASSQGSAQTAEFKIPNPFAKTGFIGG